jgi:hypothetical protein
MKRLTLILLLMAAGLGAAAPGVAAQDPDSARATLVRHRLCPAAQVQISTTFGERFSGHCVMQDARLLVIQPTGEQPVLYTAVDSIWVRGPGTRPGTITGAWVGGGLGAAVGALFVAVTCAYECLDEYLRHGVSGAVVGTLTGMAAGKILGDELRVWRLLYPR